jgi:hypothetical protein
MNEKEKAGLSKKISTAQRELDAFKEIVRVQGREDLRDAEALTGLIRECHLSLEALDARRADLEGQIKLRTGELERTNRELQSEITERKHAEAINQTLYAISNAVSTNYNLEELYRSIHISLGRNPGSVVPDDPGE